MCSPPHGLLVHLLQTLSNVKRGSRLLLNLFHGNARCELGKRQLTSFSVHIEHTL